MKKYSYFIREEENENNEQDVRLKPAKIVTLIIKNDKPDAIPYNESVLYNDYNTDINNIIKAFKGDLSMEKFIQSVDIKRKHDISYSFKSIQNENIELYKILFRYLDEKQVSKGFIKLQVNSKETEYYCYCT